MEMRPLRALPIVLVAMHATIALADSITLRPSAEVPPDIAEVRLRDVATLDGPEAVRFADVVVAPPPTGGRHRIVNPHDVRSRLDAAGIRWDLVDFNGGRVLVRFASPDRDAKATPQAVRAGDGSPPSSPPLPVKQTAASPSAPVPEPVVVATPSPAAPQAPAPSPAPVIQPDDRVTVSRELGSIAIPLTAVALEAGAPGGTIRLQFIDRRGRRDARTFTATVTGPGTATVK
jgi:hypothetical protein